MFDAQAARAAGYSDAEIAAHLAASSKFDVAGAKKAGYSDAEIVGHLSGGVSARPSQADLMAEAAARVDATRAPAPPRAEIPIDPTLQAPPAQSPINTAPTSLADQLVGAGEAALTLGTGAVAGTIGAVGGAAGGIAGAILNGKFGTKEAADLVDQSIAEGAQRMTYEPRTPAGQAQVQAIGGVAQNLVPLVGLGGQVAGMSQLAKPAAATAADATKGMVSRAVRATLGEPEKPGAGAPAGSVGAAGVDQATVRQSMAEQLPVPLKLTKGQAARDQQQLRFELESSKGAEGGRLRERYAEQNEAVLGNFDAWVDQSGAQAPSLRAVGVAVDQALVKKSARDKESIRSAYKAAEKAGELESPVELDALVKHLNESAPDAAVAPLLNAARGHALKLGIAAEGEGGQLVPGQVTLKTAETFRQAINRSTDYEPTNVRQAAIMKGLLDDATDGLGGNLYQQARAMRSRYAQQYENRHVIKKLLNTRRGTDDRIVAFEDVFDHAILKGSLDDVRVVRRVLQTEGADGTQAWKELQGATVNYLKEQASSNSATDVRGNPIVSAAKLDRAIKALEADGKLDFVFGKQGAQQIRDINELAKVIYTAPPGTVNTSNTASVVLQALVESGASGAMFGLPIPTLTALRALSRHIKDKRVQARITDALNNATRHQRIQVPHSRTMH